MKIKSKYGYCYYDFGEDYVHIYDLFVYPEYRNKGNARKLLQKAIKYIRKTGWKKEIQIVADPKDLNIDKNRLKTFYKSMGLAVFDFYG